MPLPTRSSPFLQPHLPRRLPPPPSAGSTTKASFIKCCGGGGGSKAGFTCAGQALPTEIHPGPTRSFYWKAGFQGLTQELTAYRMTLLFCPWGEPGGKVGALSCPSGLTLCLPIGVCVCAHLLLCASVGACVSAHTGALCASGECVT